MGVSVAVTASAQFRQILGIRFFVGNADEAIARMSGGGLLVVPAAPALKNLAHDPDYREALQGADLVIADSAFMVMIWNRLKHDSIRRVSGLRYLSSLLSSPTFTSPMAASGSWRAKKVRAGILPGCAGRELTWPRKTGTSLRFTARQFDDPELLRRIEERRPRHIIVTLGGGTQERLGLYLRSELNCKPSIHCVGAAIAFLSGDQVQIPIWADRMYLGWLFRCISDPRRYMPRYWDARKLFSLMVRYGSSPPDSLKSPLPVTVELAKTDRIPSTPVPSQ